jgi:hypothetical protein
MQVVRIACLCGIHCCLLTAQVWGQTDSLPAPESSWWKNLFRPNAVEQSTGSAREAAPLSPPVVEADAAPALVAPDTAGTIAIPAFVAAQPATYRIEADPRLGALDSAWHANPPAMAGYRIQLMTGPLQHCRQERYRLRGTTELGIYLEPLSANYQVLIGDFRDPWTAEQARQNWLSQFPEALVVPGSIALPRLERLETTTAEPLKGPGGWD